MSHAGKHFYGTEYEICADLDQLTILKKNVLDRL